MKTMLQLAACAMMVTFAWLAPSSRSAESVLLAQDVAEQSPASSPDPAPDLALDAAETPASEEPVEPAPAVSDEDNFCIQCHGNTDLWEGDTAHLLVTPELLAGDIHWQKGIKCQQCHGGNASTLDLRQAHAIEDGFRKISSPSDVPGFCGHCHANAEYMKRFRPDAPLDIIDKFWSSVHAKGLQAPGGPADADVEPADVEPADVESGPSGEGPPVASCVSCHLQHQMRRVSDPLSALNPQNLAQTCGACHRDQLIGLRKSVHAKAGEKDEQGAGTLMDCSKCHGQDVHSMLPVADPASPVRLEHQVQHCGDCHTEYHKTYLESVHGTGLTESGLVVTAVCADCHGAHGIFYAADRRSTLHPSNVGETCGVCHHYLIERLAKSVHGELTGLGNVGTKEAPGGETKRRASCTDCHQGHDALVPSSEAFRSELPNRCGNCHGKLADRYRLSLHGELTEFGYQPAAECADCHGAHDILPLSDPNARMALAHRADTCQRCHQNASVNFAKYDPHASYKDAEGYPLLHGLHSWFEFIIYSCVGLFALHMLFWFTRSFLHARKYGRDRPCVAGRPAIEFFVPVDRLIYLLLIVAFIGLVLTGLPLKYGAYPWAKRLATMIGGFQTTSVWHHAFALLLLVCCAVHVAWGVRLMLRLRHRGISWRGMLFGLDSPLPGRRDVHDFLGMLKWFIGLGNKPRFERWAYWEKFDYWSVYGGLALFGVSGLMLWFPNFFCLVLPGTILNIAKVVHSEIAVMAAGFVFMIHVFNTHLRPEKFPLDASWFTGVVSEDHLRRSRPDFLARMQAEGKLDSLRTVAPPKERMRWIYAGALLLLAVALCVLAIIVVVSLGK